jgi:hypothetical protein
MPIVIAMNVPPSHYGYDHFRIPYTNVSLIELFTEGPGSTELISGSIFGSNWPAHCISDVLLISYRPMIFHGFDKAGNNSAILPDYRVGECTVP